MKSQVRAFIDTSLVESVAKRKYYQKGEDWEKLSLRVASFIASVETSLEINSIGHKNSLH